MEAGTLGIFLEVGGGGDELVQEKELNGSEIVAKITSVQGRGCTSQHIYI